MLVEKGEGEETSLSYTFRLSTAKLLLDLEDFDTAAKVSTILIGGLSLGAVKISTLLIGGLSLGAVKISSLLIGGLSLGMAEVP